MTSIKTSGVSDLARCASFLIIVAMLFAGPARARAEEPVTEFLTALRSRGYFDLALAYLERVSTNESLSPELRTTIAYEKGATLVTAALAQRQLAGKERYLDQAQSAFESFEASSPQHPLAISANAQLGNILVERARLQLTQADRPSVGPEQKLEIQEDARGLFDRANTIFVSNTKQIRRRLEDLPKALDPDADAQKIKLRDQLRSDYVQAQFISAMVQYEKARTHDPNSQEYREALTAAEEAFGVVAEKYRRRLAGLSAVLFQGRCREEASDPKGALSYYEDLLTLPDSDPALRSLKTKALLGALSCWLHEDAKQPKTGIQRAEAWLKQERPNERSDPDWLRVKLLLAESYLAQAQEEKGRVRTGMLSDARRLALEVAKQNGASQSQAQELLVSLGAAKQEEKADQSTVTTFDEAMEAAKEAINERQLAVSTVALLQGRLPQIKDPENRQEVQQRLAIAKKQVDAAETRSLALFAKAHALADAEVSVEQLNTVRYYLCTLHYYRGDYHSAAVLGDFLARRFPSSAEGRRAASVALASLVKLYGDGSDATAAQLSERIASSADFIASRWSGQPEAADALSTLVTLAVQAGELDKAEAYLRRISKDSPKRGIAELVAGQAMWNQSIQNPDSNLDARQQAIELLTQGLKNTSDDGASPSRVAAALSLAQHHLDQGEAKEALALLEDPGFGPMTLADQNNPAIMSSPALVERTYTLDILAHIASLSDASLADTAVAKALAALESLKNTVGDDPAGQRRLSTIYVALARNLQDQIRNASPASRRSLSSAFQQFLDRAAATADDVAILNWIAESYLSLGRGLMEPTGQASEEGKEFLARAAATYQAILDQADAGKIQLSPADRLRAENRLAVAYRDMGEFREAVEIFANILQEQETQVYVQFEAARTLQLWGDRGNPDAYLKAIRGDRQKPNTNQNLIWGYGRIAKIVGASDKLRKLFHDARYRLAESRYQYALQQPKTQRLRTLAQAKNDIVFTAKLYPDMGGEPRKSEYDQLLRRIQQTLGQQPTGLGR